MPVNTLSNITSSLHFGQLPLFPNVALHHQSHHQGSLLRQQLHWEQCALQANQTPSILTKKQPNNLLIYLIQFIIAA